MVKATGTTRLLEPCKEVSIPDGARCCHKTCSTYFIKFFEQFKSYEGLYFSLGSYLSSSEDLDIHFKYIKATTKTSQIKGVKHVTRKSNFYDAEKTKNFLMEARLPDARLLINVCNQFGFVPDLIYYLYSNNMLRYIEGYVQKLNPSNGHLVVD